MKAALETHSLKPLFLKRNCSVGRKPEQLQVVYEDHHLPTEVEIVTNTTLNSSPKKLEICILLVQLDKEAIFVQMCAIKAFKTFTNKKRPEIFIYKKPHTSYNISLTVNKKGLRLFKKSMTIYNLQSFFMYSERKTVELKPICDTNCMTEFQ